MDILIITHFLNGLLMIIIPIGLAMYLTRRWRIGWRLWGIGAATFILSQIGHIPFNAAIGSLLKHSAMLYWPLPAQTWFNAIFAGLSAGVFEEGARYLVLRFWAKEARSWRHGLLFGAGHGGAEAILIGTLVLVTYFFMLAFRQADLSALIPNEQLETARQQLATYWSTPWYASLIGALERVFALACHLAMTMLVLQAFIRKNLLWLGLAILYHAGLDASAVAGMEFLGIYWTEAIIGGFALLSIWVIVTLRWPETSLPAPGTSSSPHISSILPLPEDSPSHLEGNCYPGSRRNESP